MIWLVSIIIGAIILVSLFIVISSNKEEMNKHTEHANNSKTNAPRMVITSMDSVDDKSKVITSPFTDHSLNDIHIIDLGNGRCKVNQNELRDRYGSLIPERIFFADTDIFGNLVVSTSLIERLEKKLKKEADKERRMDRCAELNNKGMELEKNGKIEDAITTYEENIKPKCYPSIYPFERLMVLYRRKKDYKNEIRVINRAIKVFNNDNDKYVERLIKAEALLEKQNTKK